MGCVAVSGLTQTNGASLLETCSLQLVRRIPTSSTSDAVSQEIFRTTEETLPVKFRLSILCSCQAGGAPSFVTVRYETAAAVTAALVFSSVW